MNTPEDKLRIYYEELTKADHWVTVTSKEGHIKLFTNSTPTTAAVLLVYVLQVIENMIEDQEDGEDLLPTLQ